MKPNLKYGVSIGLLLGFGVIIGLSNNGAEYNTEIKTESNAEKQNLNLEIESDLFTVNEAIHQATKEKYHKNRYVALYGNPEYSGLGALGEQPIEDSVKRVKKLANEYQEFSDETVVPTFELIATIAAAELTENNDYSREIPVDKLKPLVNAAKEQGIYVILDLQPGRSTFLKQAKLYERLLIEPHVGLALDPEWRLLNDKARHLVNIGSVSASEINETSKWLAYLVNNNSLPQKIFMIHQFKLDMITERDKLDTSSKELKFILHMDGHGAPGSKTNTWNIIKDSRPMNLLMAWKNFYNEDSPTLTPKQTMSQKPKPWLVSYQ